MSHISNDAFTRILTKLNDGKEPAVVKPAAPDAPWPRDAEDQKRAEIEAIIDVWAS